jgi:hypothetical protein
VTDDGSKLEEEDTKLLLLETTRGVVGHLFLYRTRLLAPA